MYVAGHTEMASGPNGESHQMAKSSDKDSNNFALEDYELRLTPSDEHSALEIARRPTKVSAENKESATR
jgi:hypothetical protein